MELNGDFGQRVAMHSATLAWSPSPMAGVDRRMLDRLGAEVARATSIVRYAPGSHFPRHIHHGGEEYIVLAGTFQDDHGDFPVGSYVRNPPTSAHTPRSEPGCTIFVKLWQFDLADRSHVIVPMDKAESLTDAGRPGVSVTPLFADDREVVRRECWAPNTRAPLVAAGGAEILVLSGTMTEAGEHFDQHDWLRLPDGYQTEILSGPEGATLWVKTGHLRHVQRPRGS